ncbi:hypothetical protein NOSIN_16520 [Nocardiopsis sinuspersici]|nr:hypothetical protein NOSIN_16520 [Nocardiopsis sinuspersici]
MAIARTLRRRPAGRAPPRPDDYGSTASRTAPADVLDRRTGNSERNIQELADYLHGRGGFRR